MQAYYSDRGEVAMANAYADTAFSYLETDTSSAARVNLAWLHNNVAGDYAKLADYQQAIDHLMRAAGIFEQHKPGVLASTYGNIAMMYAFLLLPERALEYDKKAIAAAVQSRDTINIIRRNLGYTARLLDQKRFDDAEGVLNRIAPLVKDADSYATNVFFNQNMGLVLRNKGQYPRPSHI